MAEDISSLERSVIAVTFEDDASAYRALTQLKELDAQHRIVVRGAAVVGRAEDGEIVSKEELGDADDDEDTRSVLAQIGLAVEIDHDTLLAEVLGQSPQVVDTSMALFGGTVLRRPAAEVEAEVAAAQYAERTDAGSR
jgi:hypothetical protein